MTQLNPAIDRAPPFDDPNDIKIGMGRVIYVARDSHWALPGGTFTTDRELAETTARNINSASLGAWLA